MKTTTPSNYYERRAVCFLDILGFKQLVQQSVECEKEFEKIKEALSIIQDTKNDIEHMASSSDINFTVTQFSDSVVLSFPVKEKDQLAYMLNDLHRMIQRLLEEKILVRGAITQGLLYHDKKSLFGPAMNEVYTLESKIAVYPRVIISRDVLMDAKFSEENQQIARNRIMEICSIDSDGWHYLDYLLPEPGFRIFENLLFVAKDIIYENIVNQKLSFSIKQKLGWINRHIHEISSNIENYNCKKDTREIDMLKLYLKENAKILYSQTVLNFP